jgi:hypothetical protein
MTSLDRELRKDLEKTVKQARRVAETGAHKAVEQLGVGEGDAPKHLSPNQRALRNRLRTHGRQLGDRRDVKSGTQVTSQLVQECAYEHWHRMLFARFLAETDLLIEPESGVPITLDEARELGRENATDWLELASNYAERMLPQIFRRGDPVLDIVLPPETQSELEDLLKKLPPDVFQADDSLGWVYQFWQADKKDEINNSATKIGADELPAVTQLFTEDYMVLFLLHNTLGAWWAGKVLNARPDLAISAQSEDELRSACKVGNIEWSYLRFLRDADENGMKAPWRPAAGPFENWPKAAKDVTLLDPCMGSGHFLVFALPILASCRMVEEGLSGDEAIDAVLRDNLYGLEIDPRCTQIAAFNLALAAWRIAGYRPLPRLNLACSGLAIGVAKAEWLKLAERAAELADSGARRDLFGLEQNLITSGVSERAKNGLERIYDLFGKAPLLGSLIDPRKTSGDIFNADFAELEPVLTPLLSAAGGGEVSEMAVAAQGLSKAAEILARTYTLVATNVPYLGRGKQVESIRTYCSQFHQDAAADLSTCFVDRCIELAQDGGTAAMVSPQNWLFLGSYKKIRSRLLNKFRWNVVARLGPKGFQTPMYDFNIALICISRGRTLAEDNIAGVDVSKFGSPGEKALGLKTVSPVAFSQRTQLNNPDVRLIFDDRTTSDKLLSEYADCYQGARTGDRDRFVFSFWEVSDFSSKWEPFRNSSGSSDPFDGLSEAIRWDGGNGELSIYAQQTRDKLHDMHESGNRAWGRLGAGINQMAGLKASFYFGEKFDGNVNIIVPKDQTDLPAIWSFCCSEEYAKEVRRLDQKIAVTNATLVKVPFNKARWASVAEQNFPTGLPSPFSRDASQWIFTGHPKDAASPLQVAVARLVGYKWPRQLGHSLKGSRSFGADALESYAVSDGIACLTALKGEPPAAELLSAMLGEAFGANWTSSKLAALLAEVGAIGWTLDDWLRDTFFMQHCELFSQRPFVWHVWDGRRDGFHALVNYHRLVAPGGEGRRTLEKLIYSFLGDWIDRQRADQKVSVEGADGRLAAAEHLRAELKAILEGEPPYDIFIRWKRLCDQPIGWEPDINDGVRMNIRPFMTARPLGARRVNASILRITPKINWDKHRGKEPRREKDDYPWFWSWDEATEDFAGGLAFDGNRWNNLHYRNAIKQAARNRTSAGDRGKI